MFGSLIGIMFSTSEQAIQILPLIIFPVFIFGGLAVNLNDIPSYSSWIQYLSPVRHAYMAILWDQMGSPKMHNIVEN